MKFSVTSYNAVATWKWDTHPSSSDQHKLYHYGKAGSSSAAVAMDESYISEEEDDDDDEDEDDDVCGICRLAFESTCPVCKVPGDDCPLIWGECTHIFHMHCLLKWIETESSKGQCPMDRRPWATADRAPDQLPTTTTGEPVATVAPGPIPNPHSIAEEEEGGEADEEEEEEDVGEAVSDEEAMDVDI